MGGEHSSCGRIGHWMLMPWQLFLWDGIYKIQSKR